MANDLPCCFAGDAKKLTNRAKTQNPSTVLVPRVLSSWTRVLLDALDDRGIDGMKLAATVGLKASDFKNPNASLAISKTSAFWQAAVDETGDDALGLWVSRYVKPTSFHAMGFATMASHSLLDAFQRMERYSEIISNAERLRVELDDRDCICIIESRSPVYSASAISLDAILSQIVRFVRFLSDPYEPPKSLSLVRERPKNHQDFSEFFRCPITFSAPVNKLIFASEFAKRPLSSANIMLAEQHDMITANFIDSLSDDPFAEKLRKTVIDQLPSGNSSIKSVAVSTGTSVRSLQRWLAGSGQSYSEYLGALRRELAEYYLTETDLPVTEISFLLGFGSTSSLSRAFAGWTDTSPRAFRNSSTPALRQTMRAR
jgi:AraC-like DNA-binding protein